MRTPQATPDEIGEWQAEQGEVPGTLSPATWAWLKRTRERCPVPIYLRESKCKPVDWTKRYTRTDLP